MTKIDLHHNKKHSINLSKFPSTAFPVPTKSGEAVMPVVKRLSFWPHSPDPSFKGNPCRAEFSHLSSGDTWLWSQQLTFPREDESPKPVSVQKGSISPILHSKGSHIGGCHPARVAESEVSNSSLAQPEHSVAPQSLNWAHTLPMRRTMMRIIFEELFEVIHSWSYVYKR